MMHKVWMWAGVALLVVSQATAQTAVTTKKSGGFPLTPLKDNEATDVKDQNKSGTCWSFSTLSFFESELKRMGKGTFDLSEMFVVRHAYIQKAIKYVRMHGAANFGPGGAFHDPINVLKMYGMMPQDAYQGNAYGEPKINHGELDEVLKAYVDAVIKNKNGKLSTSWITGFTAILDSYLGKVPETFTANGKSYNAKSYGESLGLNPNDYVDLTSFTHHPFYTSFILEIPDNWSWDPIYNLPIDEFMLVLDNAINNGYTVAWGADVSDKGFSHKNGVAIVPAQDWDNITKAERDSIFNKPIPQRVITQAMRQADFDNYETTDDHGMQIVGIYKDAMGQKYYKVKNSWGAESNDCGGYFYASEAYVKLRSINIMVHKTAIPNAIREKLYLPMK